MTGSLFGSTSQQVVGLLVDRRQIDTSTPSAVREADSVRRLAQDALGSSSMLCWPSGYFAKTEHHLQVEADGHVWLTGGRWQHLELSPVAPPRAATLADRASARVAVSYTSAWRARDRIFLFVFRSSS